MPKPSAKRNRKADVRQASGAADGQLAVLDDWQGVLAHLPPDLEEVARQTGALQRRRGVKCASDLLRLVLAYSVWDWSFRQVGAWATVLGLAELSDVAVRKRLRHSRVWLSQLLGQLLGPVRLSASATGLRLRLFDASVITQPGSTGTDWRTHIGFDVGQARLDEWETTDAHGGESLLRHAVHRREVVVADRAYGHRPGLSYLLHAGAQFVVRTNGHNLPLKTAKGKPLNIRGWLAGLSARTQRTERGVQLSTPDGEVSLRLVAHRLPASATQAATRRAVATSRKNGNQLSQLARVMAGWVVLVSNLPEESWSAGDVLAIYRVRWQVELLIKRLKSVLKLDQLRSKDQELAQVYLLGKALAAVLLDQQTAQQTQAVQTWFDEIDRPISLWRWTALWWDQLRALVRGSMTVARLEAVLPKLGRYLRDSPRRRRQQLALARHWLARFTSSQPAIGAKIALQSR